MKKLKNRKFEAILFDKDGVLINSIDTCYNAFNDTLKQYGKKILSKNEYIKECWGIKAERNISRIFKELEEKERKKILTHYYNRREELEKNTKIYPNTVYVLNSLKGRYKLGIITNTTKKLAEKILTNFSLINYFDIIIGGDEGNPKPAPDLIHKASKKLGIETEKILFVGDTKADLLAGKAAGTKTVIITTSESKSNLEKEENIIIIDDIIELLKIV
jgi:HAD superfamily hydrolase (TIGR01509 family)